MHMRIATPLRIALIALVTSFLLAPVESWARPPRARERHCVIQSIEYQSQRVTLQCGKDTEPLELIWTTDTRFVRNGQFADAATLEAGETVTVYYRSPFFGKKFATKVVWQNGSNDKLNKNEQRKET